LKVRTLLILLLLQVLFPQAGNGISPVAKKGIIDLRHISDSEQFIINLNGEWEFYWNKMLHPHDFAGNDIKPDYYGLVPSYWTDYPQDKIKTTKFGYATYRLRVLLPPGYRKTMAFDMPVFDSSYDIYINNRYFGGNGIGIPDSKQKHLFTSTEITSTPGTEDEKGTGLGLKLCAELININKGTISVESKDGEGSCFSITLPV
jgi:hypothetical protein